MEQDRRDASPRRREDLWRGAILLGAGRPLREVRHKPVVDLAALRR
jgi:hypothetical protein